MTLSDKAKRKIREGFLGQKMIVLPPDINRSVLKNDLIKRLYITAIGFYPHASFHDRERESGCSQYILLYCTSGTGTITLQGKTFRLIPNHFIILPKNVPHHYHSSKEDPWTIYWVHFMGENADLLYTRYLELGAEIAFSAFDEQRIEKFERIFNLLNDSFEPRSLELANITLLDFISNFIYDQEINPSGHGKDKISESIAFMRENIHCLYSVQDFAHEQNLSVTHYSRLFRAKTGNSPNQYFNQLKIQKSCQYLYFTDRSIKEICAELGFDDPYYFSRLFKKLMGKSPSKYKSQHRKD